MSLFFIEKVLSLFALIISIFSLILIVSQRNSPEQQIASVFSYFAIISCAGYAGILISGGNLEMLIFSTKLKYAGSFSLYVVFPLFIKYFQIKTPKAARYILNIFTLFLAYLIFTFDYNMPLTHGWFFKDYYAVYENGLPFLKKVYNFGHTLYTSLAGIYSVGSTILFLQVFKKKKLGPLSTSIILYIIVESPALFYLFEKIFMKITHEELFPIVPLGISISVMLFTYLIMFRHFCDVNELANNVIFDLVNSPALVLNKSLILTNINKTAVNAFPELTPSMIGKNVQDVFSTRMLALLNILLEESSVQSEKTNTDDLYTLSNKNLVSTHKKTYQAKLKPIYMHKSLEGYVMWMEDVTLLHNYKTSLENEVSIKRDEIRERERELRENAHKLRLLRDKMIIGFSSLSEHHDMTTEGHLKRTSRYVHAIALELLQEGEYSSVIDQQFVDIIKRVAPLHDIGKTYIDEEICNKPEKLTLEEFKIMQEHTLRGADFIEQTIKENVDPLFFNIAYNVTKYHHEWWNGDGYPCCLKGEEIPVCARIMAVADVYDALCSKRPYKEAFSSEKAYELIEKESASHFDPKVVDAFIKIKPQIEAIAREMDNSN